MAGSGDDGHLQVRQWRGHRVAHVDRGDGPETVVLLHGLLSPASVNAPLADALVEAGYRVVQPELLGHGRSDAPADPAAYRLDLAGDQVLDLLDDLGIERVVIGGMSLGANVSLELATRAPERLVGMICEMPVLERGTVGVVATLAPLWVALRVGVVPLGLLFRAVRRIPRTGNTLIDAVLGCAGLPRSMAAVLRGYATGPTVPPLPARRRAVTPALVIAHGRDIIHPLDDAEQLAGQLPNASLVQAHSALELRTRPSRLCAEVVAFVDRVFAEATASVA